MYPFPCFCRASALEEEYEAIGGEFFLEDDGWLATHGAPKGIHCVIISEKECMNYENCRD